MSLKKIIVPFLAAFLLIAVFSFAASADSDYLKVDSIIVKVNGEKQSGVDASGETITVDPGAKLELEIKLKNIYLKATKNPIEDILAESVLEQIDDGEDLEDEADEFDLEPERSQLIKLAYDIPLKVDAETTYTLSVDIAGEDKNNTEHTISLTFDVEVNKDNHDVRLFNVSLEPTTIDCSRKARLRTGVINVGESEEEGVSFIISVETLGPIFTAKFDLVEDYDSDSNSYMFDKVLDLSGMKAGEYNLFVETDFYGGKRKINDAIIFSVQECASQQTQANTTQQQPVQQPVQPPVQQPATQPANTNTQTGSGSQSTQQQTQPSQQDNNVQQGYRQVYIPPTKTSSSWDGDKWVIVIIMTDIALVVLGVLIYSATRKRKSGPRSFY